MTARKARKTIDKRVQITPSSQRAAFHSMSLLQQGLILLIKLLSCRHPSLSLPPPQSFPVVGKAPLLLSSQASPRHPMQEFSIQCCLTLSSAHAGASSSPPAPRSPGCRARSTDRRAMRLKTTFLPFCPSSSPALSTHFPPAISLRRRGYACDS